MDQISKQLTRQDREDYFFHLGTMKRSGDHVVSFLKSADVIQTRKLYLWNYATWEEFCEQELGITLRQIRQIRADHRLLEDLGGVKIGKEVGGAPPGAPEPESAGKTDDQLSQRAIRALRRLPDDKRDEALAEATEKAGGKTPTGAQMEAVVDRRLGGTPEAPVVTDARGSPVKDPKLQGVFTAGTDFDKVHRYVANLKGRVEKLLESPAGAVLAEQRQDVERDRQNILAALKFSRPYTVCPYCDARKKDCEACRGRGWVTKHVYDQSPAKANP